MHAAVRLIYMVLLCLADLRYLQEVQQPTTANKKIFWTTIQPLSYHAVLL